MGQFTEKEAEHVAKGLVMAAQYGMDSSPGLCKEKSVFWDQAFPEKWVSGSAWQTLF